MSEIYKGDNIMKKFTVIEGIFKGHKFDGEVSVDGKTIWDLNTQGRGYPIENCKEAIKDASEIIDPIIEDFEVNPIKIDELEVCPLIPPSGTIFYMEAYYKDEKKEQHKSNPSLKQWQIDMVKDLRQRTACGMMECKKALEGNYWDFYTALEYLRDQKVCKGMPHHGYKKE